MSDATVSTPVSERVQLDYPSADIWLHVTTEVERKYRVHACRKEPWTVEWLDGCVQPGDVLYDIGANVGAFTLIAAVGRGARAVAFEPSYANYGRLCENLHLNGCDGAVVPFPLPLAGDLLEASPVPRQGLVVAPGQRGDGGQDAGLQTRSGPAVIDRPPLPKGLQQQRVGQDPQMPGNPGLALLEHRHQIAHRRLPAQQGPQQAQAAGLSGGIQLQNGLVQIHAANIKRSLYVCKKPDHSHGKAPDPSSGPG